MFLKSQAYYFDAIAHTGAPLDVELLCKIFMLTFHRNVGRKTVLWSKSKIFPTPKKQKQLLLQKSANRKQAFLFADRFKKHRDLFDRCTQQENSTYCNIPKTNHENSTKLRSSFMFTCKKLLIMHHSIKNSPVLDLLCLQWIISMPHLVI